MSHEVLTLPPLPASFYAAPAPKVAKALLGKALVVRTADGAAAGVIVETEAYLGDVDAASHAFRGPTRRNASMFRGGGIAYVYLSYGINICLNVVTSRAGDGQAVLIRALAPLLGVELMAERRGAPLHATTLTNGPGKLTQALGLTLADDGRDYFGDDLKIVDWQKPRPADIAVTTRVGITKAADLPLRFYLASSPYVSRKPTKSER